MNMLPIESSRIVRAGREYATRIVLEECGKQSFDDQEWANLKAELVRLIAEEESPFRLGELLRLDAGLDMPVDVVLAVYDRLFALGVKDHVTRVCYATYALTHRERLEEASTILEEVSELTTDPELIGNTLLGHHPVFYGGPA